MGKVIPKPKKRGYLLPPGCKDLIHVLKGTPAKFPLIPAVRVNHRIRAPEVRVIGERGRKLGIMPIANALRLALSGGLDLVEIAPDAKPPICRIVDFGKFRYELSKKGKKHK